MPKMVGLVLVAFADKILTPDRVKEMLRDMKGHLRNAHACQDETVRMLQKELSELELATNRLWRPWRRTCCRTCGVVCWPTAPSRDAGTDQIGAAVRPRG